MPTPAEGATVCLFLVRDGERWVRINPRQQQPTNWEDFVDDLEDELAERHGEE